MKPRNIFWLITLFAMIISGSMIACGDDDDDDDDDDDNPSLDDDADDDDVDAAFDACVGTVMTCYGFDAATANELCTEYYDLEQQCDADGATDDFIACVGNDCDMWETCATDWEDAINC